MYIYIYIYKVKLSRYRPGVAQRVGRGTALLFHDRGTRRGEWSAASPGRTLLPGKTRYPFYGRLGGPQNWPGWAENLTPPTGIRSWTVQPVISHYTNWATWLTLTHSLTHTHTHIYIYIYIYKFIYLVRNVLCSNFELSVEIVNIFNNNQTWWEGFWRNVWVIYPLIKEFFWVQNWFYILYSLRSKFN